MKSRTVECLLMTVAALLLNSMAADAQVETHTYVLVDGAAAFEYELHQDLLNKTFAKEAASESAVALSERAIAVEFDRISEWKAKYNSYLKTAEGLGSALNAAYHIFYEGSRLLRSILEIRESVKDDPEGALASVSMQDIYIETFGELLSLYESIRTAVSAGGKDSMLTGEQRLSIMWDIEKHLDALSDKFHRLSLVMRQCSLLSNWNHTVIATIPLDKGKIAEMSMKDWSDALKAVNVTE